MVRLSARVTMVLIVALVLAGCRNGGQEPAGTNGSNGPSVRYVRSDGSAVPMQIEVADTPELQSCGLMHRTSIPDDHGMLFVFQGDSVGGFWNRNTFIPLTLAWIDRDGVIVDITDLPNVSPDDNPQINTTISPRAQYRYVVEANQGWFERNNVKVGDKAEVQEAVARGNEGAIPICREKGL